MPTFKIHGIGVKTQRNRSKKYKAFDAYEAKMKAEADGTIVESIEKLSPPPATEEQLKYAKALGIDIPEQATKDVLSCLIGMKKSHDEPATQRYRAFAAIFRIEIPDIIGKRMLFDAIRCELGARGREDDLLRWFIFRVYTSMAGDSPDALIKHPNHQIIRNVASLLIDNKQVLKSIRGYESGSDLIWFGEWAPDGRRGGSNRTIAYKTVKSLLLEAGA